GVEALGSAPAVLWVGMPSCGEGHLRFIPHLTVPLAARWRASGVCADYQSERRMPAAGGLVIHECSAPAPRPHSCTLAGTCPIWPAVPIRGDQRGIFSTGAK